MLTSRRLRRSGPAVEDGLRSASRSRTGRTALGARSSTIVRTGGTAAGSPGGGSLGCGWDCGGSLASGRSGPSVVKLHGSRTISSGLIGHNLHRLDFGHQTTEISDFFKDL
jgi:hypothetical protein